MEAKIACWEALEAGDPLVQQARQVYEATLAAEERIPWEWLEKAVAQRCAWRPGNWSPHLLLAAQTPKRGPIKRVIGFAYGAQVPDYGGYACYLGIDPDFRGRGAATMLLRTLIQVFRVDASCGGEPLPFVVWESRRPEAGASSEDEVMWRARVRLFEKMGAWWIAGLDLLTPNAANRQGRPVKLQLFLIPVDKAPDAFNSADLKQVAAGLLERVYRRAPGDPLYDGTLLPDCRPTLKPLSELWERVSV